jgi:hypothetical protein
MTICITSHHQYNLMDNNNKVSFKRRRIVYNQCRGRSKNKYLSHQFQFILNPWLKISLLKLIQSAEIFLFKLGKSQVKPEMA